ncbi:hypothetical protein C8J57DRAFT_1051890 [Mycena rebaudengoi]|nr:hypothetical protein C8J57DRAFT_1051890 [Mycena rebaudengoi]
MVLLRFAPSPTGGLHLGGLRMALYNHLYARKNDGKWLTARRRYRTLCTRFVPGSIDGIRRALEWAGLEYDYGPGKGGPHAPYFQSERRDLYHTYSTKLLSSGHAYRCFCSMDTLAELREKFARTGSSQSYDRRCLHLTEEDVARRVRAGEKSIVRINSNARILRTQTTDLVFGLLNDAHGSLATDPVLLKADGLPTYHLANVVDDHSMGITHVLRGEEWLTSLPLHLDIYSALGFEPPQFAHIPLLLNQDGSKMSKRNGDVTVDEYMRRGWERGAILNWLALAGWGVRHDADSSIEPESGFTDPSTTLGEQQRQHHPHVTEAPDSTQMMTMPELISQFDLSALTHRAISLDPGKLAHLNKQHITAVLSTQDGLKDVTSRVRTLMEERGLASKIRCSQYHLSSQVALTNSRVTNLHDILDFAPYLFMEPDYGSEEAQHMIRHAQPQQRDKILAAVYDVLEPISEDDWNNHTMLLDLMNQEKQARGLPSNLFLSVVRHALTATKGGSPIAELMVTLGKSRTLARLKWSTSNGAP